jgi:hypothetical protein
MTPRPLIDFVVIGAMKCGTTALHHHLDRHPDLGLATAKELNFFFGDAPEGAGNSWRGVEWYERQLPGRAALRGEASPGYTSPDHPEAAGRMARLAPRARLVYLVRDPLGRALSQYRHHRRDGTERRPLEEALVDPRSHYVRRSLYAARLEPFLAEFPPRSVAVVHHDDLLRHTRDTVSAICRFLGVDPGRLPRLTSRRPNRATGDRPEVPGAVARRFTALVEPDLRRFAEMCRLVTTIQPAPLTGSARRPGRCVSP